MSAEDLEKYETEMELTLYREYRDVVGDLQVRRGDRPPLLPVQPGRREGAHRGRRRVLRGVDDRRVGVGHVPPGAVRQERQGADLQGRQRRGAQRRRRSTRPRPDARLDGPLSVHRPGSRTGIVHRRRAASTARPGSSAVAARRLVPSGGHEHDRVRHDRASAGARRVRRVARRAPPRRAGAWSCSTATGAATPARSTWCCATATVLVVCEVKTRSSHGLRHARSRRSPPARSTGCAGWRPGGSRAHDVPTPTTSGSTWSACWPRRGARSRSSTCEGSADGRSRPPARSRCTGADRAPDRRPGRRLAGAGRHHAGRPCRRRLVTRPATGAGWRSTTTAARLAGDPAGHDPALAGRPAQARHPLRPGDRGRGARGRRARLPRRRRWSGTALHRRAHPRRRLCAGARGAADGDGRGRARHRAGLRARAAGRARRRWCRGWRSSGSGRWPRWSPMLRGRARCPRRRRSPPLSGGAAADLARRGAARGPRPGRPDRAWRTSATPSRSRRPAATT